ncbi:hypothetical protein COV24_00925 [candidate division WWE3 bacterium CG10_big_fil_rev_8_21_14_0_10_32_10]|uniref:DNA recombination protein RmuC n=1 Tax=candidate division WWE3 bacterium CG10_big_fil_rev_8_21_14_0_10_32_10 TaxID=1975090 RepID=A0A2H0RBC9_UNCKA|nr:MAG: hypothetical protein COV24_00925 [candidate division WWE3 bacterium CG10_big_fil_rev_8_21_14_0_10_32_10]
MEIYISALGVLIIIGFLIWFKKDLEKKQKEDFKNVYNELMTESLTKLTELSKNALKGEKESISVDLKNKKESIESMVKKIEDDLKTRQKELFESRQETIKHFSDVKRQVQEHQKITEQLRGSTEKLGRILSNNQLRGEWGEKILEDILNSAGLEKGIHYLTQQSMASGVKPDVVILLPEKRRLNIDAKFPLSKILQMSNAEDKSQIAGLKREFESDVKTRLREISKRDYIDSSEDTMDFAIMFVPNEIVFGFINKEFPAVIEEAFSKKIIIASPFSVYAIARTIMQGYRNYYYERNIKEVLIQISSFKDQFVKFQDEFEKLGRSFDTAQKDYKQISNTRVNQMQRTFSKIEEAEKENKLEAKADVTRLIEE